ncbi:hypothetical protein I4F81_004936 [Pyropia yezoensis]|uniref:Uncharacterized protein n=1 Tax=Pyropia yezoensis TaxID=2788 RepID=A0ACC3BXU5_PYRYE|nr:hypothetical protein I4F81_004936 [Neopyropia yezoensis]
MMTDDASIELEHPRASAPAPGAGEAAPYTSVVTTLRASTSGMVGVENTSRIVNRIACLYDMAAQVLQGIALQPHPFAEQVIEAMARNFRDILVAEDCSWTELSMKDAEAIAAPGSWALLLPMMDCRTALTKQVQTLKVSERYSIRIAPRPERPSSEAPPAAGEPAVGVSTSVVALSAQLLRAQLQLQSLLPPLRATRLPKLYPDRYLHLQHRYSWRLALPILSTL